MRDLVQYPVTRAEIVETIKQLADVVDGENRVGDMRPLLLRQAAQYVAYNQLPVNELGLVFLDYTSNLK